MASFLTMRIENNKTFRIKKPTEFTEYVHSTFMSGRNWAFKLDLDEKTRNNNQSSTYKNCRIKKKKTFIFNELKGEQINQNMTTMRSDFVTNAQTRTKRKNIMRENEIFFIIFLLSNEKWEKRDQTHESLTHTQTHKQTHERMFNCK